jgi:hypothetical protein
MNGVVDKADYYVLIATQSLQKWYGISSPQEHMTLTKARLKPHLRVRVLKHDSHHDPKTIRCTIITLGQKPTFQIQRKMTSQVMPGMGRELMGHLLSALPSAMATEGKGAM